MTSSTFRSGLLRKGGRSLSILLAFLFLTACTEDPLILPKKCSQNDTYCEDVRLMNSNGTAYENLTDATDLRDPTNNISYEDFTP